MFKSVLKKLFSSFTKPSQQALAQAAQPQQISQPLDTPQATKSPSLKAEKPLSPHEADFLNYLFGESELHSESDPFSDFVALRIEKLLLTPKSLLNELPVMPASVTTLMSELNNDDFNVDALLEVIEREPSMAADVIKVANSARYRRSEKEVTDLKTAFMNMGAQGLVESVIDSYLKNFTPSTNIYWRYFGEKIWQHSAQTADYAKELLNQSDSSGDEATAYFVGLIRNLGKMIIFQVMVEAFQHVDPSVPPNSTALKRLINSYAIRLSYALAKYWELPPTVMNALGFQASRKFESTPLGIAVFEANYLSELQCLLVSKRIDEEMYEQRCQRLSLTPNAQAIAQRLRAEADLGL